MSEWKEFKLGSVINTNECSVSQEYPHREILYLDTGSITKGKIDQLQPFSLSDAPSRAKRLVKHSDIVYSTVRPIQRHYGYIENPTENLVVSTGFVVISCLKKILDPKFTYYYLSSDQVVEELDIIAEASTSTYPSLKPSDIEKLTVRAPIQIEEQKAIAAVLSSLDDKIDLLHRQNKTLESIAETLFRQWFLEEAQGDWENCVLADLCKSIACGGTPSTKIEAYYTGDINWYSTKELNDSFLFESSSKITTEGLENSAAKLFPAGTVVMAIYAAPTVGRLGILGASGAFNQAACGMVANDYFCCGEFLYLYLMSKRDELNAMASGSAQQNLNLGKIKSYPAFKVSEIVMDKFKEVIKPIFAKIKTNSLQIRTIQKLRDNLLPKLMSGEVRVEV